MTLRIGPNWLAFHSLWVPTTWRWGVSHTPSPGCLCPLSAPRGLFTSVSSMGVVLTNCLLPCKLKFGSNGEGVSMSCVKITAEKDEETLAKAVSGPSGRQESCTHIG